MESTDERETGSDEEYDVWPGCYLGATGAKSSSHHRVYYYLQPIFTSTFGLDGEKEYSFDDMEKAIMRYAKEHSGLEDTSIKYDPMLWSLFGLPASKLVLKVYHLDKYLHRWVLKSAPMPTHVLFGR
jgi:hypothetical protein